MKMFKIPPQKKKKQTNKSHFFSRPHLIADDQANGLLVELVDVQAERLV